MNVTAIRISIAKKFFKIKRDYAVRIWYSLAQQSYSTHTHIIFAIRMFGHNINMRIFPSHEESFLNILLAVMPVYNDGDQVEERHDP